MVKFCTHKYAFMFLSFPINSFVLMNITYTWICMVCGFMHILIMYKFIHHSHNIWWWDSDIYIEACMYLISCDLILKQFSWFSNISVLAWWGGMQCISGNSIDGGCWKWDESSCWQKRESTTRHWLKRVFVIVGSVLSPLLSSSVTLL